MLRLPNLLAEPEVPGPGRVRLDAGQQATRATQRSSRAAWILELHFGCLFAMFNITSRLKQSARFLNHGSFVHNLQHHIHIEANS